MQTPQIIVIVLTAVSLVVNLLKNGESKKYNFVTALIDSAILIGLLIWGGFFG
jgi:amino acid transporter